MYDYEPKGNSDQPHAEVFHIYHGETLFYCTTDSVARQLIALLEGSL